MSFNNKEDKVASAAANNLAVLSLLVSLNFSSNLNFKLHSNNYVLM